MDALDSDSFHTPRLFLLSARSRTVTSNRKHCKPGHSLRFPKGSNGPKPAPSTPSPHTRPQRQKSHSFQPHLILRSNQAIFIYVHNEFHLHYVKFYYSVILIFNIIKDFILFYNDRHPVHNTSLTRHVGTSLFRIIRKITFNFPKYRFILHSLSPIPFGVKLNEYHFLVLFFC